MDIKRLLATARNRPAIASLQGAVAEGAEEYFLALEYIARSFDMSELSCDDLLSLAKVRFEYAIKPFAKRSRRRYAGAVIAQVQAECLLRTLEK